MKHFSVTSMLRPAADFCFTRHSCAKFRREFPDA
jgi:hypothetical protein